MEETRQSILVTACENTDSFVSTLLKENNLHEFLHRDECLPIRSSNIDRAEQDLLLDVLYDIDGIVLGIKSLTAVNFQVRYLNLLPVTGGIISPIYHILKKHLDLHKFRNSLSVLRHAKGFQLFYEHGWEVYIGMIPKENENVDMPIGHVDILSKAFFENLFCIWRSVLQKLVISGHCLGTIKKNPISSCSKLHILPADQNNLFSELDMCVTLVPCPERFMPYIFAFRFGERKRSEYFLDDFNCSAVRDQSIHVAATLSGINDMGYLWSRQGLQSLVGDRGNLSTCLSFGEAGNFQSNLDGRMLNLSPYIRKLVMFPIRFVQFYGDTPHVNPSTRPHPVTGSIVHCGLINDNSRQRFDREARKYISTCMDNVNGIRQLCCRLELVIAPKEPIIEINPKSIIDKSELSTLLDEIPLLVPFDMMDDMVCLGLRGIGEYLVKTLQQCFDLSKGLGSYEKTWISYQFEFAIEKFLWGKPLFYFDNLTSINLGPGIQFPSRSKTDWLEFLALDEPTATSVNENPPNLKTWFVSEKLRREVENIFGFTDYLSANNTVLGRKTMEIILTDLYESANNLSSQLRFGSFLAELKSDQVPRWAHCNGNISAKQLSEILSSAKGVKNRLGTSRMLQLLKENGLPMEPLITGGLVACKMTFFPAVKRYDTSRHNSLQWNGIHLWKLNFLTLNDTIDDSLCQSSSLQILSQLGNEQYIHRSKLVPLQNIPRFCLPWIRPILEKMEGCKLKEYDKSKLILFFSCIGFLQQGWYVCYRRLQELQQRLPVSPMILRRMEILSTKLLECTTPSRIWRLHESIPFKIDITEPRSHNLLTSDRIQNKEEVIRVEYGDCSDIRNEVQDFDSQTEENVVLQEQRHYSANMNSKWSVAELGLVHQVKDCSKNLTARERYRKYQALCTEQGIPDRTFKAFERKLSRL